MFGLKSKLKAEHQRVLDKARNGDILTEDEIMLYVSAHQILHPECLKSNLKNYSVLWFDSKRHRGIIVHTRAINSVEAIENVIDEIPPCVNCTSVLGHIPVTIRFA